MLFSNIMHPRHFNFQIPQLSLNPKLVGYGSFCAIHMEKKNLTQVPRVQFQVKKILLIQQLDHP